MAVAFSVDDVMSALPLVVGTMTSYESLSSFCMALMSSRVISRL